MSLLQNEDFAIYQLRTAYLANIQDGIGERLINVNTAFLNDPAFKTAGWNANPPEIKRTYSPPIPAAVTSEYFQAPPPSAGLNGPSFADEEDDGGTVSGPGINDALGPSLAAKRRRRREQLEEDDSSSLSDESDEEIDGTQRPANQIRFAKMPARDRSGSSPLRSTSQQGGPSVLVTSPSRPPDPRLRKGSLGAVGAMKSRARRDTTTSSDVSSENDLDPSVFKRRQVKTGAMKTGGNLTGQIREDPEEQALDHEGEREVEDTASGSDDSSLASGFSEPADPGSLTASDRPGLGSSSLRDMPSGRPSTEQNHSPPKQSKQAPLNLPELPPPRPISTIQPASALAAAIKAKNRKPVSPFERFATLSGKGEPSPLYVKLYPPSSSTPSKPLQLSIRKATLKGAPVTVSEAIGFALWACGDEAIKIPESKMNVNWWTLRIVEDEEVDYDFPALGRTRPLSDFTSNNNRPPRGRSRELPWDEFALVEASESQFSDNERLTPLYSQEAAATRQDSEGTEVEKPRTESQESHPSPQMAQRPVAPRRNPVTDNMFSGTAVRQESGNAAATSTAQMSHALQRSGETKTLKIHYLDTSVTSHVIPVETTTDTYIAEVFDQVCKRLNVDKALFVLKVTGTSTIAPADRTVEALGENHKSLDLVRRRFVGDGSYGLSGSPGSTSPNAPLMLTTSGTPKRTKRAGASHPLAQQPDAAMGGLNTNYRRFNVIRKQPMSFTPSHQRVIILDGEYLHIMPPDVGKERLFDATPGKTSSYHFSSVVGCKSSRKHPKTFRVVVFREKESKTYYFEASSAVEAGDIIAEINRGMEPYKDAVAL